MFSEYTIRLIPGTTSDHPKVIKFLKKHHYLPTVPKGIKHVFILLKKNKLKGVALFGYPVGTNIPKGTTELKRFCLSKLNPKNTGSFFMAKCMSTLKKFNEYNEVITYADPSQGHQGTLYKASNFVYVKTQPQGTPYYIIDGKKVGQGSLVRYKKYRQYKGTGLKLMRQPPKLIFKYVLNRRKSNEQTKNG